MANTKIEIDPSWHQLPKTMREAAALGKKQFFTGIPCKAGHLAPRSIHNGACIECLRLGSRRRRKSIKALAEHALAQATSAPEQQHAA